MEFVQENDFFKYFLYSYVTIVREMNITYNDTYSSELFSIAGDNIMTAMSVARGCFMVQPQQKIVLITAVPQANDAQPPLTMEVSTTQFKNSLRPVTDVSSSYSCFPHPF